MTNERLCLSASVNPISAKRVDAGDGVFRAFRRSRTGAFAACSVGAGRVQRQERRRRLCGSPTAPANLNAPVVSAFSVQHI